MRVQQLSFSTRSLNSGCPATLVATNVGGAAEAIVDGESGYLVKSGDQQAMAPNHAAQNDMWLLRWTRGRAIVRSGLSRGATKNTTELYVVVAGHGATLIRSERGKLAPGELTKPNDAQTALCKKTQASSEKIARRVYVMVGIRGHLFCATMIFLSASRSFRDADNPRASSQQPTSNLQDRPLNGESTF